MLFVSLGLIALWICYLRREFLESFLERHLFALATLGCAMTLFLELIYQGREIYSLWGVVSNPGMEPVIGHRLLFAWIGILAHHYAPHLSSTHLILISQAPACLFSIWAVGLWCKAVVGRNLAWVGQVLAVFFFVPTFRYYTYYDVGIMGLWALTFSAIYRGKFWLTIPLIAIATLNHENAVILCCAVVWCAAASVGWKRAIGCGIGILTAYAAVRVGLHIVFPSHSVGDVRLYTNAYDIAHLDRSLFPSAALLGFRYVLAALGYKYAPQVIQRMAVIWPPLVVVTWAFGSYGEARQFTADIPYCIALVLIFMVQYFQGIGQGTPTEHAEEHHGLHVGY